MGRRPPALLRLRQQVLVRQPGIGIRARHGEDQGFRAHAQPRGCTENQDCDERLAEQRVSQSIHGQTKAIVGFKSSPATSRVAWCQTCLNRRQRARYLCRLTRSSVHREIVGSGARRSRRFGRRTPGALEDFSVFSAATVKQAEARAPNGSNDFGMHGTFLVASLHPQARARRQRVLGDTPWPTMLHAWITLSLSRRASANTSSDSVPGLSQSSSHPRSAISGRAFRTRAGGR